MNARPSRGEIWQVDMGIAGKVRPCLLLTDYPANDELALVTVLPHTTALRGNEWEVAIPKPFLKEGAFHIQQVQSISLPKLMRRFGSLTQEEWNMISAKLAKRLGLVF
jgi:mRNA interferase MazF